MSRFKRFCFRVQGGVQGVGFRYFTRNKAEKMGLQGYVQNLPNGDVEIEVEGPENQVSLFMKAIKSGPPGATVKKIITDIQTVKMQRSGFEIRF